MDGWSHVTLTFARQRERTIASTYRVGYQCWSALRKRITRRYVDLDYIQTWERHQSGFPHMHMAARCYPLQEGCQNYALSPADKEYGYLNFVDLLQADAVACGFGSRGWIDPISDVEAMSGYLVKLAREITGAGIKSQIPTNAPPHFRRIRASRGVLAPPHKDPDITGLLRYCEMPVSVREKCLAPPMDGGSDA